MNKKFKKQIKIVIGERGLGKTNSNAPLYVFLDAYKEIKNILEDICLKIYEQKPVTLVEINNMLDYFIVIDKIIGLDK